MGRVRVVVLLFLCMWWNCFSLLAEETKGVSSFSVEFSGLLRAGGYSSTSSYPYRDKSLTSGLIRGQWKIYSANKASYMSAINKSFAVVSLEGRILSFQGKQRDTDSDGGLYEAYIQLARANYRFRIGKQIIRWGKTDEISPVDNINPIDTREFFLVSYEDRKIPVWLMDVKYISGPFTVEGVLLPVFQKNSMYFFDRDFAIFKHFREEALDYAKNIPLYPHLSNYLSSLRIEQHTPSISLKNMGIGGRISISLEEVDMAISYLHSYSPFPYIEEFPIKGLHVSGDYSPKDLLTSHVVFQSPPVVPVTYKHRTIYGGEFETTWNDMGIRGECAYFDSLSFLTSSLVSTKKRTLWYVVGADYDFEGGVYINLQVSHERIFNYNSSILFFKKDNIALLGKLSKEFSMGLWKVGLDFSHFFTDDSSLFHPYILCKKITNVEIEVGAFFFTGEKDSLLGQYSRDNKVYTKLTYYF